MLAAAGKNLHEPCLSWHDLLMQALDEIDRRILAALQVDARITNQELAERIGLSPSPTLRRVKILERDGVISGYRAVVSAEALGLGVLASIELSLNDHSTSTVERVERVLQENPSVVEAHMVAGGTDYLLKVRVRDLADFERFVVDELRALDNIASIRTQFAYGTVKDGAALLPPARSGRRPRQLR